MNWEKFFHRFLARRGSPVTRVGIEPGLYHYQRQADGLTARLHLRVDASGNGVLLANAACAVRLHPSGVVIAKGLLEGQDEYTILEKLMKAFKGVTGQQVAADMNHVLSLITSLEKPHHDYPILNPADPSFSPHVTPLERPISADVPLCKPFYMEPILSRLWDEGIPHATIIAGKDPVEKDLIRAVEKAEDLGLITGVRGRGSDLAHCARIPDMAQAGLDHLDVYCLSIDEQIHNGLVGKNDYKLAVKAMVMAQKREVCPVAVDCTSEAHVDDHRRYSGRHRRPRRGECLPVCHCHYRSGRAIQRCIACRRAGPGRGHGRRDGRALPLAPALVSARALLSGTAAWRPDMPRSAHKRRQRDPRRSGRLRYSRPRALSFAGKYRQRVVGHDRQACRVCRLSAAIGGRYALFHLSGPGDLCGRLPAQSPRLGRCGQKKG